MDTFEGGAGQSNVEARFDVGLGYGRGKAVRAGHEHISSANEE